MSIFNSLGSNYNFNFVLKALFAKNKESYKEKLIKFLEEKYGGKAILSYKGRQAIELALEILRSHPKLPYSSSEVEASTESRSLYQVAINGFTCFAVYKATETVGYKPVCFDLDPSDDGLDLNFSANELSKAIRQNPKIKAVIVQNTLGFPCDIEGITKVCHENNLILIEDLAHCVGTVYKNGKEAGTVGDFVALSFSQDKIIDAVSGGALIIRNKKYQEYYPSSDQAKPESREVKNNSSSRQDGYHMVTRQARTINFQTLALKQQLTDRLYPLFTFTIRKTYQIGLGKLIHFALKKLNLLSKLMNESFYTKYDLPNWYCSLVLNAFDNLKKNLEHRKQIVNIYNSMFDKKITYPSTLRYPIFIDNRKSLINYLKKAGVYLSDIWYDDIDKNLPNCQIAANTILNLPTHRNVSEEDAKNICGKINQWIKLQ